MSLKCSTCNSFRVEWRCCLPLNYFHKSRFYCIRRAVIISRANIFIDGFMAASSSPLRRQWFAEFILFLIQKNNMSIKYCFIFLFFIFIFIFSLRKGHVIYISLFFPLFSLNNQTPFKVRRRQINSAVKWHEIEMHIWNGMLFGLGGPFVSGRSVGQFQVYRMQWPPIKLIASLRQHNIPFLFERGILGKTNRQKKNKNHRQRQENERNFLFEKKEWKENGHKLTILSLSLSWGGTDGKLIICTHNGIFARKMEF